jgi:hypothetical protein
MIMDHATWARIDNFEACFNLSFMLDLIKRRLGRLCGPDLAAGSKYRIPGLIVALAQASGLANCPSQGDPRTISKAKP